jgi:hypothetical protein
MSVGGATPGTAAALDVGTYPGTADNTFARASTVAGGSQPYWSGWWTLTPASDGFLTLHTGDTVGTGLNDTIVNVYEQLPGDPPPGSVLLYSDDDSGPGRTSRLTARPVSAGVTYYIQVGSFNSDGDGITTYHLAASLADAPVLPNPRFFTIPGGALTDPGLVMGPTVVGAPVMPALSVSRPAEGLPDATFIFDGASYVDAFGGSGAWIIFDATLSYLADGTCDETSPEVGLNIFTVDHGLPFTWEEDWDTLEVGANDAIDDYGREVPRGQWSLLVERKTYIIQLTTPPGNDVRFILRVSDFGAHTGNLTIPDQAWNVTRNPWPSETGDPIVYPTETIPWVRDAPDGSPAAREDGMRSWERQRAFHGKHDILQAPGKTSPATDGGAIECSWRSSRLASSPFQWWSSDNTASPPDDVPACFPATGTHESGESIFDGRVGYSYESGHAFGGTDFARWNVYDAAYRIHIADLIHYFTATAGINPLTLPPPTGFVPDDNPLLSDLTAAYPDLLGVDIAMDRLDVGTLSTQTTRMYVSAVDYANADGSSDPWGPAEDASATNNWRGTTDGPEDYHARHPDQFVDSSWTAVPDSVWAQALADEAAQGWLTGTPNYQGALSVVALFDAQRTDTLPTPAPTGIRGETVTDVSSYQFPVLRFRLRPSTGYYYANAALVPVVEVQGLQPVRLQPRDDDAGIYSTPRMWPPAKSGARLYGSPP